MSLTLAIDDRSERSILFLMNFMKEYLNDLLRRMDDDSYRPGEDRVEGLYESGKTVSWAAHDEARNLQDAGLAPELIKLITIEKDAPTRTRTYFVLGWLARNTRNLESKQFLVTALTRERETDILVTILDRLADIYKPSSIGLTPIVELTDRNASIRRSAYLALTNSEKPVEDFLLKRLSEAPKEDVEWLINALMYVGTAVSMPAILKHINSRKPGVYSNSRSALTVIMLRQGWTSEDIQNKIKVSAAWVTNFKERLTILTHPDLSV